MESRVSLKLSHLTHPVSKLVDGSQANGVFTKDNFKTENSLQFKLLHANLEYQYSTLKRILCIPLDSESCAV